MYTILLLIISSVLLILFLYVKNLYNFWANNGIPQEDSTFPMGNISSKGKNFFQQISDLYLKRKNNQFPFYGIYFLYKPVALATDVDFIRAVLIKDFNYFVNRGGVQFDEKSNLLTAHLLNLKSDRWRHMRSKLSPTFSSGKMKYMFPTIVSVGEKLVQCLNETIKSDNVVEVRDLSARFTTDVIGSVGFGIECNSLNDPNNIFREMGRKLFETPKLSLMKRMVIGAFQPIVKLLQIELYHKDVMDFFTKVIKDTVDYREKNNIRRNDFMDLLLQLKDKGTVDEETNEKSKPLTFNQIAPQAFVFFAAGFETSSTTMTYILYELSQDNNQFIQEKARNEINSVLKKYNNELTYDALREMTYVDQVIDETLRKYPPAGGTSRKATSDYEYQHENRKFQIPKDVEVFIPIYGIHHDPEYYPNPDVFDPDRFSPEEIAKRPSCTFLPFGDGPRNCIAMRFGKLQAKIGLVLLLKNFNFSICDRTEPQPMRFSTVKVILSPTNGVWLKVSPTV